MLTDIIDTFNRIKDIRLERCELDRRLIDGRLLLEIGERYSQIQNVSGLPNPYYTKVFNKAYEIRKKHPVLTFLVDLLYYSFHPYEAIQSYKLCCGISKELQKKSSAKINK